MADKRISELTALTGANSADDDLLVIVDSSASETKSITLGELEKALGERDFSFADNDKLVFGNGDDLQIYHDSATSTNKVVGSIDVTGTVTADGLTVDSTGVVATFDNSAGSSNTELALRYNNGYDGFIQWTKIGVASQFALGIDGSDSDKFKLSYGNFDATPTDILTVTTGGNVGIGTTSPSSFISYANNLVVGSGSGGEGITIHSGSNDYAALVFADGTTGDSQLRPGQIVYDHSTNGMFFSTNASVAMRIDSSGNLLVGRTSVGDSGDGHSIRGADSAIFSRDATGETLQVCRNGANGDLIRFKQGTGNQVGEIGCSSSQLWIGNDGTYLLFHDDDNHISPWNGTAYADGTLDLGKSNGRFKDLYLSGGVVFGSTGGSVTSKTLHDYEEGTWTPTIGSGTTWVIEARYIKIGNQVHLTVEGQQFSDTTSATNISIGGLPFTPAHAGMGSFLSSYRDDTTAVTSYVSDTNNTVAFYHNSRTSVFDALDHNMFNNSSAQVYWSVTYFTA